MLFETEYPAAPRFWLQIPTAGCELSFSEGVTSDAAPRIHRATARLGVPRAEGQSLVGTLGLRPALTCTCQTRQRVPRTPAAPGSSFSRPTYRVNAER